MQEVLTVQQTEYLVSDSECVLTESVQENTLIETTVSEVSTEVISQEVLESTSQELLEVAVQGPPGPPGSGGGGGSYEQVELTDYTVVGYSYVGYATRICRVDYSTSPPTVRNAATSNLTTSWSNRYSLTYI